MYLERWPKLTNFRFSRSSSQANNLINLERIYIQVCCWNTPKFMAHISGPKTSRKAPRHPGRRAASQPLSWLHTAPWQFCLVSPPMPPPPPSTWPQEHPTQFCSWGLARDPQRQSSRRARPEYCMIGLLGCDCAVGCTTHHFIPGRVGPLSCQADRQIRGSTPSWLCDLLPTEWFMVMYYCSTVAATITVVILGIISKLDGQAP